MPDINEKGVSVPQWIANILVGSLMAMMGWGYNQQSQINKEFLDALYIIKSDIRIGSKDYLYLIENLRKLEGANQELEKENRQQQREIDELKRYHRP